MRTPVSFRFFSILILLLSFAQVSISQINLGNDLVAYYKLNNNTADSSTLGLTSSGMNIVSVNGVHNIPNTAYSFNGTSSYINCGTSNRGVTNVVSISAWVKTTSVVNVSQIIVSKYDWHVDKGYFLFYKNGYPNIAGRNSSGSYSRTFNSTVLITDGNWHHVLGVVSGNTWQIWVDGVLLNVQTSSATSVNLTNAYPLHLGNYYDVSGSNFYFNGDLDEVRIYKRVLTSSEIAFLSGFNTITYSTITPTVCSSYTSPSGNYIWNTSGSYQDTITNVAGTDSVITINLLVNKPNIVVSQTGNTIRAISNSNYSYQWIDCNNANAFILGAQDSIFTPTLTGSYAVVINNSGCQDTSICIPIYSVNNVGNSIFLDGVNTYLEIPNHASLHSTTNLTLEAWIKPCSVTGSKVIYSKNWCNGNQNSYYFSVIDGKLLWNWFLNNCGVSNSGGKYQSSNIVIQENVWQHVAVVHSPTSVKLFVNGQEVSASLNQGSYGNLRPSNEPLRVGSYRVLSGGFTAHFSGQMDELRIWNTSISDSLIGLRYYSPLVGNEPGLQGYYNMDNFTTGPNQVVPNNGSSLGAAADAITRGSSSFITPFYLDANTSYILGPDTVMYTPTTFNASIPSGSYLWQDGSTSPLFSANSAGQFYVSFSNSCISTTDTINMTLPTPNLDSGLVAYFKLDSNGADSSTTAIHGTGYNLTNTLGIQCDSNTAYSFNGTSSKIVCGPSNRGITNTVNMSAWIKTTTNTGHMVIVDKYNWSVNKGYSLAIKNGVPYVGARNKSGSGSGIGYHTWNANQTFLVSDGQWHHLLGVVSQNNLEIWLDGVLMATNTMSATNPDITTNYDLNIGYYYKGSLNGTGNYFNGTIDDVRLYNRDLTSLEIEALRTARYRYTSVSKTVCDSMVSHIGDTWYSSGIYQDTVTNTCLGDSIYTINLTVLNGSITAINEITCGTYTSPSGNYNWSSTGTYFDTLTNVLGCDSIIEINLTVNAIPVTNLVASTCYSYTSPSGNNTWYATGVYYDTLSTSLGCDSVLSIAVTILPYEIIALTEVACNSYTSPSGNSTWSTSGTYLDIVSHANDCDTLYNISLTILQGSASSITVSNCDSYSSPSGNYTWSTSGVYMDTIPNTTGCDSVMTINLTVIPSASSTITPTVCASYTSPSGNYVWTNSGTYLDTVSNVNGCDSLITVQLLVNNSYNTISTSACNSYASPSGKIWVSSGVYQDTVLNSTGCDSILTINLTINATNAGTQSVVACNSYYWIVNGLTYLSSGLYDTTFTNIAGCDSVVTLNLTVNSSSFSTINVTNCDSYTSPSGSSTWTGSGTYSDVLTNSQGCDSVITINLTIVNSSASIQTVSSCNSYFWSVNSITYAVSGIFVDTLLNSVGCDSIITLNLSINTSSSNVENVTACNSYTWASNGTSYTVGGQYLDTLVNTNGCDSLLTLNLTLNQTSTGTQNITSCDTYISPSGIYVWNVSGTYLDTIPNLTGCDSIITTVLTIQNSTSSVQLVTSCDSYTWSVNSQQYISSGTYLDTIINTFGCDSIISLLLTINTSSATSETITACDTFTWVANGIGYNTSGVYSETLTNAAGCDSVVTLNLTINNSNSSLETVSVCGSYYWLANAVNYSNSGVYLTTLQNVNGCDSIATLDLTVNTSSSSSQSLSVCDSLSSPSGNYVWTTSGTYMDTLVNSNGCDSIITTNLTVNYTSIINDTVVSCDSYFWLKNNVTYVASGTYSITVTSGAGCDSISNLILTINTTDSITQTETRCDSYTWAANGNIYTSSGTYVHSLVNAAGCDSVVTLNLSILNSTVVTETVVSCGDYTWVLNGNVYPISGTYVDTTVNSNGCDSIVTLNLTINTNSSYTLNESSCGVYTAPDGSLYSTSGQYFAVIPNSVGCDSTITINLMVTNIDTSVGVNGFILTANATGSFTYQWLDCNNGNTAIVGATNQNYTPSVNGDYAVEISDGVCLERSNCIKITGVGVEELNLMGISIYPNPAYNQLKVSNELGLTLEVTLLDITGKSILKKETQEVLNSIDVSNLPSGFYLVKVEFENQVIIEKVSIR